MDRVKSTLYILHAQADGKYERALSSQLAVFEKLRKEITILRDSDLTAGTVQVSERQQLVDRADIVALLISPGFWEEYELALRALAKNKRVIPILVESTPWSAAEFGGLRPLPSSGRFIDLWEHPSAAWLEVVEGMKRVWDSVQVSLAAASVAAAPPPLLPSLPSLPPRPPRKPLAPGEKLRVLFITANPSATSRLHLGEEMHQVQERLLRTTYGQRFTLVLLPELRVSQLASELMRHRPHIVHFSGHGSAAGAILLVNASSAGAAHAVDPLSLRQLFHILDDAVQCVVLNSCYSAADPLQAQALADVTGCVIGMDAAIADASAITFSASFYEALGFGRSLAEAFHLGKQAILMMKHPGPHIPQLHSRTKEGPSQLFLIDGSGEAPGQSATTG